MIASSSDSVAGSIGIPGMLPSRVTESFTSLRKCISASPRWSSLSKSDSGTSTGNHEGLVEKSLRELLFDQVDGIVKRLIRRLRQFLDGTVLRRERGNLSYQWITGVFSGGIAYPTRLKVGPLELGGKERALCQFLTIPAFLYELLLLISVK